MSEELTKEDEIILSMDGVSDGWQTTYTYEEVKKALVTHAQQEAIAFAEWTERNDYTLVFENNLWGQIGNRQNYTTEQLYELYQQSKTK